MTEEQKNRIKQNNFIYEMKFKKVRQYVIIGIALLSGVFTVYGLNQFSFGEVQKTEKQTKSLSLSDLMNSEYKLSQKKMKIIDQIDQLDVERANLLAQIDKIDQKLSSIYHKKEFMINKK